MVPDDAVLQVHKLLYAWSTVDLPPLCAFGLVSETSVHCAYGPRCTTEQSHVPNYVPLSGLQMDFGGNQDGTSMF